MQKKLEKYPYSEKLWLNIYEKLNMFFFMNESG